MEAYLDYFLPKNINVKPDRVIKHYKVCIFFLLITTATLLFYIPVCFSVKARLCGFAVALSVPIGIISLYLIKTFDLISSALNLFVSSLLLTLILCHVAGGLGVTTTIVWFYFFPIVPTTFLGLRHGIFYTIISILIILAFEYYKFQFGWSYNEFSESAKTVSHIVNITIGPLLCLSFIGYLYWSREEAIDLYQNSDLERKKLLSMVFHDMTNILAAAYHRLQPERIGIDKNFPKTEEYISGFKNLEQMQNLLNHVRELEKLKNIDKLPSEKVDLNLLIADSLNTLREQIQDKEISIKLDLREKYIFTNKYSLQFNILNNLISNAIKFTPRGETISISSDEINSNFELSVSNPGDPIMEEVKRDLFKINKQATSLGTEGERGSGFGLAIAHDVAKKLGGVLTYQHDGKTVHFNFKL